MIRWLTIPEKTRKNAYEQIAERTGMSPFAVEKDWWVVQTLCTIFEMDVGKHLVFKGGTSLSKAWRLVDRFSEDIDLALDREFLGFKDELSKKQRTVLRKAASKYTSGSFFRELQARFSEKRINGIFHLLEAKDSDQDPRVIEIYYPNVIPAPGYLEPRVQIEVGCRSLKEPYSIRSFGSLIDEYYPKSDFANPFVMVPTVNPERTFLEKIFLLHEEFQRPPGKIRVDRLSRHLYDVFRLSRSEFAEKALANPDLYTAIVEHRYKYNRVGGVNYNLHQPESINPIPAKEYIEAWRADYQTMIEQMIYEVNPPTFDEIINGLTTLKNSINSMGWRFATNFSQAVT